MGANAQTTVPTFTASQVLTADQMNQSARTGVPVFATTVTRDAGFGGTGEKTLAEGQMCYVEGTGFQTYNGTSWVTWGTAPSSGLTLITSQTIGTGVSSVTVSNCFSSTYDNYKIIMTPGTSSADADIAMILGATTTGYYWAITGTTFANAAAKNAGSNASSWAAIGHTHTDFMVLNIDVLAPNLAKNTHYSGPYMGGGGVGAVYHGGGYLANTTQYTSFTLTPSSGTYTGGTINVYGYQKS
jgi:hypothetical protein